MEGSQKLYTNSFTSGINKDTNPLEAPEGTASFALNAIRDGVEGDKQSYQSEPGNDYCFSVPDNYTIIKELYGEGNESYIFSTDGSNSEIGVVNDCTYTTLINTDCLGFKESYMITGSEYRVKNGCERVIYFSDGHNPDKAINIDKLDSYKNPDGSWNCNLMRLNPVFKMPCIDDAEVLLGGSEIEVGMYSFVIELLDSKENVLYRSIAQGNVPITYNDEEGKYNIETYDALVGGVPKVFKSVRLSVSNLDSQASYYRVAVIKQTTGDGLTRTAYTKSQIIPIDTDKSTFTVTGYNPSQGDIPTDVSELLVPPIVYETSEVMEQVQNRLVRGNLRTPEVELSTFQRAASKIGVDYDIKEVPVEEYRTDRNRYWDSLTLMGDEVYSLGVMYLSDKGELLGPFHIPGPPANISCSGQIPSEALDLMNRCISIRYTVTPDFSGGTILEDESFRIEVTYNLNGQNNRYLTEPILVGPDGQTDVNIDSLCFTQTEWDNIEANGGFNLRLVQVSDPDIIIRITIWGVPYIKKITNRPPSALPTYGWDDTPFVEWSDELLPFYDSEEAYRALFDTLQQIWENEGNPRFPRLYGTTFINQLDWLKKRPEVIKWWQVYNTSFKYQNGTGGRPGYYECSTKYLDIKDCNGESIWGVDCTGEPLAGTPIRHHRMPDRTLEPVYDYENNLVRIIGLKFNNIEYPDSSIVGHFFVRGIRYEGQKTVIDKGMLGVMSVGSDQDTQFRDFYHQDSNDDNNYVYFKSPKGLTNSSILTGTHFKLEQVYKGECNYASFSEFRVNAALSLVRQRAYLLSRETKIVEQFSPLAVNFQINSYNRVSPDTFTNIKRSFPSRVANYSLDNKVSVYEINKALPWEPVRDEILSNAFNYYAALKVNREVFCDIFSIDYTLMHNCSLDLKSNESVFGGDTIISDLAISNLGDVVSSKANIGNSYGIIEETILNSCGDESLDNSNKRSQALASMEEGADKRSGISTRPGIFFSVSSDVSYFGHAIFNFFVESDINFDLRHSGSGDYHVYAPEGDVNRMFRDQLMVPFKDTDNYRDDDGGRWKYRDPFQVQEYRYNQDFSIVNRPQMWRPLPSNFDYCNKCSNVFANRLAWSEISFDEDVSDFYKIFLANNYKDLPAHRGMITGLKYKDNKLLIHTTQSTFIINPNPQEIQTNTDTLYIGTGSFLGLPPMEMMQSDLGYAGSQSFTGYNSNEFGYCWVDNNRGSIFIFDNKLNEISLVGLQQWFKDNLPMVINLQFPSIKNRSLGVFMAYDPRFKRLIISKRDFELKPKYLANATMKDGYIYVDGKALKFEDSTYFYNRSWTISYSFEFQSWTSWHSYLPNTLYNTDTHYYTTVGNKAYKHLHSGRFQSYYGGKYDFIIEAIYKDMVTKDLHTINYVGETRKYDLNTRQWYDVDDVTFSKLLAYNSDQSTGLVDLKLMTSPYDNLRINNNTKYIAKSSRHYNISGLYDIAIGKPVVTANPDVLELYPGYIDVLDNPLAIDRDVSAYSSRYLTGKWAKVRLFFSPEKDMKKIIYLVNTKEKQSVR